MIFANIVIEAAASVATELSSDLQGQQSTQHKETIGISQTVFKGGKYTTSIANNIFTLC